MLSLGEVHNMGLNGRAGGFRHSSGDHNVYARGTSYGLSTTVFDGIAAGNAGGLQHHLTDFLHQNNNPFLHTSLLVPQADVLTTSSMSLSGGSAYGFPGTELDRSLGQLFDDDHFNFPAGIVTTTASTPMFDGNSTISPCLGLSSGLQLPQLVRESWVEQATVSGRGVKRGAPAENPVQMDRACNNMQVARKKVETTARVVVGLDKCKRPSDQADHILRERQRRDDMTSKFAVLESLLPTGSKRDRSTIVDDSIEYVKNLHHRIKLLQKRKEELAQAKPINGLGHMMASTATRWNNNEGPGSCKAEVIQQQTALASPNEPKLKSTNYTPKRAVSQEEVKRIRAMLRTSLESMQVHTDMPNQVVINMVCRPQPRLQSHILQCLESLDLVVMQCSITKVSQRLICVITAKPQEATTPTSGIVAALKYAMGSDVVQTS